MKFKNYLELLEYTKHPISELIAQGGIPLDPGMMDRLGFLEKEVQTYHVTNVHDLENLIKNQKTNKQISCFTKGGPELARLPSQPDVLLRLQGTSVIRGETDLWTLVSTRDRRWLDINKDKHSKLNFFILGVLQSVVNKVNINVDVYKTDPKTLAGMIDSQDKKTQVALYRLYIKEMEAMINKQYKYLIDYMKSAADMDYNEVVLMNFEILDVWSLNINQPAVIKLCQKKVSYAGVFPKRDLGSLKI